MMPIITLMYKEFLELKNRGLFMIIILTLISLSTVILIYYLPLILPEELIEPFMGLYDDPTILINQNIVKNIYQIGILIAIILGSDMIAGEVEKQTLEILFSFPIEKYKILISKLLVRSLLLIIAVILSTLISTWVTIYFYPSISYDPTLLFKAIGILIIILVFSLVVSSTVSIVSGNQINSSIISISIIAGIYLLSEFTKYYERVLLPFHIDMYISNILTNSVMNMYSLIRDISITTLWIILIILIGCYFIERKEL